jgi:hypothetical protein
MPAAARASPRWLPTRRWHTSASIAWPGRRKRKCWSASWRRPADTRREIAYNFICNRVADAKIRSHENHSLGSRSTAGTEATHDRSHHQAAHRHRPPEEWFSILLALGATAGCVLFILIDPRFEPQAHFAWAFPGWLALSYLFVQVVFLLVSASQIRVLGVLDSIISIVPLVAGLVLVIEWMFGRAPLSPFQLNLLVLLIATSLGEFLLTVWIRFVLNRRTIAIDQA